MIRQHEPVIHVTGLLKLALPYEPIFAMLRPRCPANAVISIEFDTSLSFICRDQLQAVIVDEHIR
jgi:hypothetical protein